MYTVDASNRFLSAWINFMWNLHLFSLRASGLSIVFKYTASISRYSSLFIQLEGHEIEPGTEILKSWLAGDFWANPNPKLRLSANLFNFFLKRTLSRYRKLLQATSSQSFPTFHINNSLETSLLASQFCHKLRLSVLSCLFIKPMTPAMMSFHGHHGIINK